MQATNMLSLTGISILVNMGPRILARASFLTLKKKRMKRKTRKTKRRKKRRKKRKTTLMISAKRKRMKRNLS